MPEVALSVQRLIEVGSGRLRLAGLQDPRRQALRLWADLSGTTPADRHEVTVDSEAAARFEHAITRRIEGEPLPYVTGWAGFRHLSLRCDGRALIPRPETEGLIDLLLQRVCAGLIADIGTGSGCIALSLAMEGSFSRIVAIDRSPHALALARLNGAVVGGRGETAEFVLADLCAPLREGVYDALISNPPYLTAAEYASLDGSVRDWEPDVALVSGEDGLEATTRLLDEGRAALRRGGWLALEVDCSRAQVTANRACGLGWEDVTIHMDLFGRERYLLARRSETR
jgi:release factor glutamine methyltransferase